MSRETKWIVSAPKELWLTNRTILSSQCRSLGSILSFEFASVDHFFARKQWLVPALQNLAGNHHTSWRTKQPQRLQVFIQINAFREKENLEKLEIWLILSHLAEIRTLTLKKNESCQNYRLQVVVNHYACNRPASWPLNVRQATKIKINIVRV